MSSGTDSGPNPGSQDPYTTLGLEQGATFDDVQKARDKKLVEAGDDPLAKAKIEASYDALLMVSLKERQLGKLSTAAASASKQEERQVNSQNNSQGGIISRLKSISSSSKDKTLEPLIPSFSLAEGQGLTIRLSLGILSIVLLLVSPEASIDLILSLSTIGVFISQVRRGRKPLSSLGWSVVLLSSGLIIGGLLINGIESQSQFPGTFTEDQLQAIPALLLLWGGSLIL